MSSLNLVLESIHNFRVDKLFWNKTNFTHEEYLRRSKPAPYIKKTIEIAKLLGLKTFVEIGSMRHAVTQKCLDYYDNNHPFDSPPCCGDGHASFFWAENNFDTYTVDIESNCLTQLKWSYGHFNRKIPFNLHPFIPMDGMDFITQFNKQIDILYLDGWDIDTEDYDKKHLEVFILAQPKLSHTHLVCIDDTDFIGNLGGKDRLLTPYLIENKYYPLFNGRQSLFLKYE